MTVRRGCAPRSPAGLGGVARSTAIGGVCGDSAFRWGRSRRRGGGGAVGGGDLGVGLDGEQVEVADAEWLEQPEGVYRWTAAGCRGREQQREQRPLAVAEYRQPVPVDIGLGGQGGEGRGCFLLVRPHADRGDWP